MSGYGPNRSGSQPAPIELRILSAAEAQRWVHGWPTAVVSLVDPGDEHLLTTTPRTDLLQERLFLADVTDPAHPHAVTSGHIDQLVRFARQLPRGNPSDGTRLLVHCRGGIGRSPAAAMVVLVAAGWRPDAALRSVLAARQGRKVQPNGLVLLRADQLLTPEDPQGLLAVWLRWASQQAWWHPVPTAPLREAMAGRLPAERCVPLIQAQTHRERGVDRGPFRP